MRKVLKTNISKYGPKINTSMTIENVQGKGLQLVVVYAGKKHYLPLSSVPLNPDEHANHPNHQKIKVGHDGKVGIGETTPTFPLHVKGRDDASEPNYVAMFDNLGVGEQCHGIQIMAGNTNHSDSGTHYIVFKESDGGTVGELDSDSGNLALSDASDERLKKNIVDTATKGLEIVNGARMRDFNWKKNDLPIKCGIIAQELQSVFPKAVKEGDDEDKTLRIRKTDFIYVLVKAVQELSEKVITLENKGV